MSKETAIAALRLEQAIDRAARDERDADAIRGELETVANRIDPADLGRAVERAREEQRERMFTEES